MKLLFPLFLLFSLVVFADDQVEPLKIKPKSPPPKERPPIPKKNPQATHPFDNEYDFRRSESSLSLGTSIQLSVVTALVEEFPEKRFRAWGDHLSLSIPVWNLGPRTSLHADMGAGFTLIRLTLTQPATSFSHTYIFFPLRARLLYFFSKSLLFEGFLGVLLRPWEYDSRSTTDGGFHSVSAHLLTPDFGAGMSYLLTDSFFLRFAVGYAHLSLGGGLFL